MREVKLLVDVLTDLEMNKISEVQAKKKLIDNGYELNCGFKENVSVKVKILIMLREMIYELDFNGVEV